MWSRFDSQDEFQHLNLNRTDIGIPAHLQITIEKLPAAEWIAPGMLQSVPCKSNGYNEKRKKSTAVYHYTVHVETIVNRESIMLLRIYCELDCDKNI